MAELIKTTDSLNEGRKKINDAITDSNAALSTANTAKQTADLAKAESESTQTQLDTIVIEGDSSVEAAQARVNNSGTAFPTLKQRLDAEHQEVTAQLQQNGLKGFVKYGDIILSDYTGLKHNVNFNLWRDPLTGVIKHDWELDELGYTNFYVKRGSSSTNDGLTPSTAWGTVTVALSKIEADASVSKAIINILEPAERNVIAVTTSSPLTKKYIIKSETPVANNQHIASYTGHSGSVVKGACPYSVSAVLRIDELDHRGLPKEYTKASTLADCETTANSYYSDGVNVYINRSDTSYTNTYVLVETPIFSFKLLDGAEVVLDNLTVLNGGSSQPVYFEGAGTLTGNVILNKVTVKNYKVKELANSIATNSIKDIKLFECRAFDSPRDGFNYHNTTSALGGTVFEYYCYAENSGTWGGTSANNNISTAHEGIHIVRIGTKGRKSFGPLIADVNGCYSLNIDVSVYDTGFSNMSTRVNSAFYFDDSPTTHIPNPDGRAWLVNCSGGSETEYGINGDDNFRSIGKITIENFTGYNIPTEVLSNLYQ